jgi:predicted phosphodiesterase
MENTRITKQKEYQGFYKDADGEAHVVDMTSTTYRPDLDMGAFITQAAPTIVRPSRRKKPVRGDSLTLAMGDAQIGYYNDEPFHDERAMALGMLAVVELQPDNICLTGDMIDLPAMSRFEQRSGWQNSTQKSIDRYHLFLSELRANAPDANIVVVHGNHEERMPKMIRKDAAELMGLRRANAEQELGVLTLQYLCRYGDLNVQGITGYPNGEYWLEDDLRVTHGTQAKRQGQSAATYLKQEQVSTIFGHDHRLQIAWQTRAVRNGGKDTVAASPGCLARTDGYVPGFHFTTNESGVVVPRAEDWQNGVLLIQHNERNHDVTPLRISEQGINIGGNYYE